MRKTAACECHGHSRLEREQGRDAQGKQSSAHKIEVTFLRAAAYATIATSPFNMQH